MIRIAWAVLSLMGLAVSGGVWASAAVIDTARWNGNSCFAFGYAQEDAWLVSAVAYPDGFVLVQHFRQNLTRHRGLWAKLSRAKIAHRLSLRSLLPRKVRTMSRVVSGFRFHMGLPIVLFGMMSGHAVGWPMLLRWRRRRQGLCLKCGYDLTGNITGRCSECGETLEHAP